MKHLTLLLGLCVVAAATTAANGQARQAQPKVEVVFVVDTTGSMGGLIAGAKAKIWSIANQVVLGRPKPIVRMGLVAYRDKRDAYVTKVFDLTDNIDQVYTDLMAFKADGGGDTPENVNQALHDAVHKISWSNDPRTLKIIYLVGDCPPHNEYSDVPTYDKTAKAAIEKGIYVNTILCGNNSQARTIWQKIATLAEGQFLAIAQDGGVTVVATPHDKKLAELNGKLVSTAVPYGDRAVRVRQSALNEAAKSYAPSAAADRTSYAMSSGGKAASNDLVEDVARKRVDLGTLDKKKLPRNMQTMTPDERKEHIAARQAEREKVLAEIKTVSAQRAAYLKAQAAKAPAGKAEGFDAKVVESLRKQAARKNLTY